MSLKRALEKLPTDRGTEAAVREIVLLFTSRQGEWIEPSRVARVTALGEEVVAKVLEALAAAFVLDCSGAPLKYRFGGDRVTGFEIDSFLRRADSHTGALQGNVERFRQRYGR